MKLVSANFHRRPENAEVRDEARGHRGATHRVHCGSFFPPSRDLSLRLPSFTPSAGFAFFAARLFGPASSDDSERPGRAPGTDFDFLSSATRSWTKLRCCCATPLGSWGVACSPDTAAVLATAAINAICKDMCLPRVPVVSTVSCIFLQGIAASKRTTSCRCPNAPSLGHAEPATTACNHAVLSDPPR